MDHYGPLGTGRRQGVIWTVGDRKEKCLELIGSAYWDIGERERNEDSLIFEKVKSCRKYITLVAVADGIGGLSEGEVASGYVVERLVEFFHEKLIPEMNRRHSLFGNVNMIKGCLYGISKSMCEYAERKRISMGTTLSMMIIGQNRYILVQLGDSAVFRCRGRKMKRISECHQNKDGSINKCIGSFDYQEPYIKKGFILPNTGFLLCSDGYYKRLDTNRELFSPKKMENEEDIDRRLKEGARTVKARGEKDNMSAVYITIN